MAKKKTKNRLQAERELRNLRKRIRTAQKAGFVFQGELPAIPSRVTKKFIDEIRSLRGAKLRERAVGYVDESTGELLTPKEGIKATKQKAQQKARATKIAKELPSKEEIAKELPSKEEIVAGRLREYADVISNIATYKDMLDQVSGQKLNRSPSAQESAVAGAQTVIQVIEAAIAQGGEALLDAISGNEEAITKAIEIIMYDSRGANIQSAVQFLVRIFSKVLDESTISDLSALEDSLGWELENEN